MGKIVKAIVGAALVVGITLATGGSLTAALVMGGLSLLQATVLSPKTGGREERQASETSLQLGEVPRQAGFGTFATAGSLNDAFNYGGEYGTDWEVLSIALLDHECEALKGFYVGDDYVAFAGDGAVAGYKGQLEVHFRSGAWDQSVPPILLAQGPGWTAADRGRGLTHVTVAYKADEPEVKNPVWTGGRPRFLWVLKGKKCYIPAKDGTVTGGIGAHRIDDPATWEWTDSPIDCRYNFQRGIFAGNAIAAPDQLVLGRGLSAIEAPPENAIAHAAVCDEPVALKAGGSEKRYTFNGMIGADEDFLTVEGYFADAVAGIIRQPDGGIEVEPGQPKGVAAEITDADILNLAEVELEEFRGEADREWINTVVSRYVEPEQKWSMHAAPIRRVYADVIEDGGPRSETPELKHVTRGTQAQRIGEIRRRLGRLLATGALSLGPRFAELEDGDWIGWTSARHFKGGRRVFRIQSYSRDPKWHMRIQLREIAAAAFGFAASADEENAQAVANQQLPPGPIAAPGETAWEVRDGEIEGVRGVQPALVIGGARDNGRANAIRLEVRKVGETDWRLAGDYGANATDITIPGVADQVGHEVAVSYLVDGEVGARRVLAPVTTGKLDGARGALKIEQRVPAYPLTSDDSSITLAAFDAVLADGSQVSFPSATFGSLNSATSYTVFRDPQTGTYSVCSTPCTAEMANRALILIGTQSTSNSGSYSSPTIPPGSGGDGTNPY